MKPKKDVLSTNSADEEKPPPQVEERANERSFFIPEEGAHPFYPYYFQNTLTKKQQHYYSNNGHGLLVKSLKLEVVSSIDDCYQLWKEFSPQQTLFDTWDFRYAFWKGYKHQPYFLVLKTDSENLALLPLWYEEDKHRYCWFGSTWQEENKFFVKDELFIPLLLAVCPQPSTLNAISTELPLWVKKSIELKPDEPKYILDLQIIRSVDDFLKTLKKKKRYNLKRDRRIIENQKPKIYFDNFSDYKNLVLLSIKRFEKKGEDTDWEDARRVKTFEHVIELGKNNDDFQVRMITVKIGAKKAAVDLIAMFNDCYYPLKCGYDVFRFPGIGNYVNLLEIDDAVSLGMKKMDFLEIGYGWKDKWFKEIPLLQYRKNNKKTT